MDEIQELLKAVNGLPNFALWVIAALFAYKVVVIGSVYGVIRLAITKAHDWLTQPKTKDVKLILEGRVITGTQAQLEEQLRRLSSTAYIHGTDVERLKKAIDYMEALKREGELK